jgi:hypothetical protein
MRRAKAQKLFSVSYFFGSALQIFLHQQLIIYKGSRCGPGVRTHADPNHQKGKNYDRQNQNTN